MRSRIDTLVDNPATAETLGLRMAPEGDCEANLVVGFVDDGQAFLNQLRNERRYIFAELTREERLELLNETVLEEVNELPADMRAKLDHIVALIEEFGLAEVREPYIKHLKGKLWEMRMKGRDGIARALYVTAHERRVVVLHAFRKKTQKTPDRAIKLALKRAKEIEE